MVKYANIYKNVNFGLYGYDDIDFKESKKEILEAFKDQYEAEIKKRLKKVGLKLVGFDYYSPREYNFTTDNIDTIINVIDKNKLKRAILKKKAIINKRLYANNSYDGYIATTIGDVEEALEELKKGILEPDIIVIQELLDLDCSDFKIYEYFINEEGIEE